MDAQPGPEPTSGTANAAQPGTDEATAAPWKILCVDDEPNIVAALRRLFRSSGYQVLTATSGAEALALLAQEPVNLIISDMRMPGMDGAQLLEKVRNGWPQTTRAMNPFTTATSSMAT